MAFKPLQYDNGLPRKLPLAASQTVLKHGTLNWNGAGYLASGAADDETNDYVALEAITSEAGENPEILCVPAFHSGVRFVATCSITPVRAQVGLAYELSDKDTLDNEATAAANGFVIEEILDAANKLVIGYWQ